MTYTPTTEEVRRVARTLSTCREFDPEMCDGCDKRVQEAERLLNSRWLDEVKAQAWEEGLEAKFKLLEGQDSVSLTNPYRQGEEHTHTKRSSFGDPYCKTCGIDLE